MLSLVALTMISAICTPNSTQLGTGAQAAVTAILVTALAIIVLAFATSKFGARRKLTSAAAAQKSGPWQSGETELVVVAPRSESGAAAVSTPLQPQEQSAQQSSGPFLQLTAVGETVQVPALPHEVMVQFHTDDPTLGATNPASEQPQQPQRQQDSSTHPLSHGENPTTPSAVAFVPVEAEPTPTAADMRVQLRDAELSGQLA